MIYRGSRLVYARWQRLRRWEFWPLWVVYLPVLLSLLWHGIRLRGLTLWVNCNPGMLMSGMALEAKGDVLDGFKGEDAQVKIAKYLRVAEGCPDAFEKVMSFLKEVAWSFPVVLKPDYGQRGQGVEIVRDEAGVRRWVGNCEEGFLVQEMVEGLEFGVHWSRAPGEEVGVISSLCGKHPQGVRGDGVRTLEQLILEDERALLMAGYYFKKYASSLGQVIGEGEEFQLAPIGTHSRGAVFTDERALVTERLREVFDELSAGFPGFCFGRYDVKVPSVEALQAGREIVVLELNGVMGEPAHVYQPGYPWWRGMCDFFAHFRRAAEIGEQWRERGVRPPEPGDLFDLIRRHCEKSYLEVDEFNDA